MSEKINDSSNIQQESSDLAKQERVRAAAEEIAKLQKDHSIWGHGVSSESIAKKILADGLYTRWTTLQDISHQLPEGAEPAARSIRHWPYEARQYILLMKFPKGIFATDVGGSKSREKSKTEAAVHVFETETPPKDLGLPAEANNHIPPEKIIGYWDDEKQILCLRTRE